MAMEDSVTTDSRKISTQAFEEKESEFSVDNTYMLFPCDLVYVVRTEKMPNLYDVREKKMLGVCHALILFIPWLPLRGKEERKVR